MMKHQSKKIVLVTYLLLTFLFALPGVTSFFRNGSYLFGNGNYEYLFGNGTNQYPATYTWREFSGTPNTPRVWDITYTGLLHLFYGITGGSYFSWIVYVWCIYASAGYTAALFLRKIRPNIDYTLSLALGLVYTAFIPINYESGYISMKIASALVPLGLIVNLELISVAKSISARRIVKFGFLAFSSSIILINIILCDPRAGVAFLVVSTLSIFVFSYKKLAVREFIYLAVFLCLTFISAFILFFPTKIMSDYTYKTSSQLSAKVEDSVIVEPFRLSYLLLFPHPYYTWGFTDGIVMGLVLLLSIKSLTALRKEPTSQKLLIFIVLGALAYLLFTNSALSRYLTLHTSYGQLFRSWRIAQYVAPVVLIAILSGTPFGLIRDKLFTAFIVFCYFSLALYVVWTKTFAYADKMAISSYQQVSAYLKNDNGDHKVLWTPEMGWFGYNNEDSNPNIGPYWLKGDDRGQGFTELISPKPTYGHYYNNFTDPYTWLASGVWKSLVQSSPNIMEVGKILGIKYFILHKDIPDYTRYTTGDSEKNLKAANNSSLVYENTIASVFENTAYTKRVWSTDQADNTICDNGLACVESAVVKGLDPYKTTLFLSDHMGPQDTFDLANSYYQIAENTKTDLEMPLVLKTLRQRNDASAIIINPQETLATMRYAACLSDTHHGIYHYYLVRQHQYKFDQAEDDWGCFYLLLNPSDILKYRVALANKPHKLILRHLRHPAGGKLALNLDGQNISIETLKTAETGYGGFYYAGYDFTPKNPEATLTITPISGINMVSSIAIVPSDSYQQVAAETQKLSKVVGFSATNYHGDSVKNLVKNSPVEWQFELADGLAKTINFAEAYSPGWKLKVSTESGDKVYDPSPGFGLINSYLVPQGVHGKAVVYFALQQEYIKQCKASITWYIVITAGQMAVFAFLNNYLMKSRSKRKNEKQT